jgi:cell division protein FtsQ
LLGIGAVVYFIGSDSNYYVSNIQVAGTDTLSQRAVADASGMEGMHIFWLNPADVAQRVAEIPSVMTATVEIGWPNWARIDVSERTPVLVWDQAGDRFWVDERGRLMQARQETSDLLLILSQQTDKLFVGDRIPIDVVAGALQLRQERPNITSLFYEWGSGLSYEDGRNWRAYFGTGLDMNQKLVVYEVLVADLLARGLKPKYVSVINKDKPFYRLVDAFE